VPHERPAPDPEVPGGCARTQSRTTLRIYLGAFPGVGKTYAMLDEAHRRKSYGEDVVVGYVETHGRKPIAHLLEGLEVVPRKRIEYHGVSVEEMDVEAVLKRAQRSVSLMNCAHQRSRL
jgi:two-component system sensor histidine kinase KdpD